MTSKFKVGDKVKVVKCRINWMKSYIGSRGKVVSTDLDNFSTVSFADGENLRLRNEYLELVSDDIFIAPTEPGFTSTMETDDIIENQYIVAQINDNPNIQLNEHPSIIETRMGALKNQVEHQSEQIKSLEKEVKSLKSKLNQFMEWMAANADNVKDTKELKIGDIVKVIGQWREIPLKGKVIGISDNKMITISYPNGEWDFYRTDDLEKVYD